VDFRPWGTETRCFGFPTDASHIAGRCNSSGLQTLTLRCYTVALDRELGGATVTSFGEHPDNGAVYCRDKVLSMLLWSVCVFGGWLKQPHLA